MNTKYEQMAVLIAMDLAGKNWRLLSKKQQQVVKLLEELGYLIPNNPANGFVGSFCEAKAVHLPDDPVDLPQTPADMPTSPTDSEKAECGWFITPRGTLDDL